MYRTNNQGLGLTYEAAVAANGGYAPVNKKLAGNKDNTTMYVVIGLAAVAALMFMPKKTKKSSGLNGSKPKKRKTGKKRKPGNK
jgi:hypothetical protein